MKNKIFVNSKTVQASYCFDETPPATLDTQHCHDTYEILYIVSGSGKYIVESNVYDIKPGSVMLIPPCAYHSVSLDLTKPYERYVVNFSTVGLLGEAVSMLERSLNEDNTAVGRYYPPGVLTRDTLNIFERFENAVAMHISNRGVYGKTLLSELIVLLSISSGERMRQDDEELGARVIRYLNINIEKNISLDKLAKIFFVSKYYLCRAFKKRNGISVHGYINQKRVMYAKQLIESGVSASVAAYRVGFGDYSSFYRAYIKYVGTSPTGL